MSPPAMDEANLSAKGPEGDVNEIPPTIIKFRGRSFDVDKWLQQVSQCRYLPENEMRTLCAMLVFI